MHATHSATVQCVTRLSIAGLSAQEPPKVAFFVGLSDNMGPVTEHTDIIFDRVLTNVGNAYSPSTGRFVARVNATFQFNIVVAAQGRQKVRFRGELLPVKLSSY